MDDDFVVEGRKLRLFWDETAGPLWDLGGELPDDPDGLRRALGLSDNLIADLLRWHGDSTTVRYGPWDPEALRRLDERGVVLADRIQREVGPTLDVRYG